MAERLKRLLPFGAAVSISIALTGFVLVNQVRRLASVDSGATSRAVEAAVAERLAIRPASLDEPRFRQALETLGRERYVAAVWLIRADGRIVLSGAKRASRGDVEEWATAETRRILSELPEGFLTPPQKTALLAASAIQSEGEHNDVLRQMVRPVRAGDDTVPGFIGVAYDAGSEVGSFPGLGYAVALFAIPLGLAVYWLSLAWWVLLDARARGERAWVWALFVLLGNLVALVAYLLVRQPRPGPGPESLDNSSPE